MAYRHETRCTDVKKHKGLLFYLGGYGIAAVAAAWAFIGAGGGFLGVYAVPALILIIAYCDWWLNDRLVCLGGERCGIGLLGTVEPPDKKSFPDSFDTDYSINLLLAPHDLQELPADYTTRPHPPFLDPKSAENYFKESLHQHIADDGIQGHLIKESPATGNETNIVGIKSFPFLGYFSKITTSVVHHFQPYLHAEFEGGGIRRLMEAAEAALVVAAAGAVFCLIPFLGWVVCAILTIVAAIISIAGIVNALNDKGKPTDVNPNLGELHQGKDVLFVMGDWVFDTAHEGWNEIHPIKVCLKIGEYDIGIQPSDLRGYWISLLQDWRKLKNPAIQKTDLEKEASVQDWRDWIDHHCREVKDALKPETKKNQLKAENTWQVHPVIDGCRPAGQNGHQHPVLH